MISVAPTASVGMLAALCLAVGPAVAAQAATTWSLLPQPAQARLAGQPIAIANGSVIEVRGADRRQVVDIVDRFVKLVADTRGLQLRVTEAADARHPISNPAITFEVDPRAAVVGDAGYRIVVDEHGILVTGRTPQGVFYGSVTVWQLLTQSGWKRGAAAEVAAGTIVDHPRFAWRALLLDSGRHFQSVTEIEQLIEWMSLNKLNVLVWHLTEDQGWRLEIPAFPELTRIGACRKAVGVDVELTGSADKPYCGFYSAAQVRDIVRYAAQRFVTVVPDLDLPGHSQAAVASYPWLGVTGDRPPVWSEWGISPWLLKPDAKTLRFVDAVLDEVMRLFPSPYVSIGGDEAAKDQWNASPEVRAQMHTLGLRNMDQLQGWFTEQVADHLVKHGRKPVGWDDELVAGAKLPASEVVMSWHGTDGGRVALTALQQGHDVVITPQESLYFDHYQSDLSDEWSGQAPMSTLQQAYATAVIPQDATAAQEQHILGVQACLWTELMPTFADAQHAVFPRIAALSELAWSPADTHDWNSFLERLPAEIARYGALGIEYADSAFAPAFSVTAAQDGALRAVVSKQIDFGSIRYTTDGSTPTAGSSRYVQPLRFPAHDFAGHDEVTLRAATFAPGGLALSAPRTQVVDTDALLSRNGSELVSCADQAEPMRLLGARRPQGSRPTYKADIGNMCWRWLHAPLDEVKRVVLSVGRVAWQFGDDAANAAVRPKTSATGEFEIHIDACNGPLLGSVPLTPAASAGAQTELTADVSTPASAGVRDVCVIASGDPRDGQWTLARMTFLKGDAMNIRAPN
jgi:hexosaminidase